MTARKKTIRSSRKLQEKLCAEIARHGNRSRAMRECGVPRASFYQALDEDETFAKMVSDAEDLYLDNFAMIWESRAAAGTVRKIPYTHFTIVTDPKTGRPRQMKETRFYEVVDHQQRMAEFILDRRHKNYRKSNADVEVNVTAGVMRVPEMRTEDEWDEIARTIAEKQESSSPKTH